MPDLPDPYGWDAWVAQTDHRIVAAMIRDKCAEVTRLRETCDRVAKWLKRQTILMNPGSQILAHTEAVIIDLEAEGSKQ
jgi:hypothetical protein